ncbi:MAG: amidophosphoribosyltransferase [Bacteroides sp.]|nr:amidophosphoribosyltransferase [Bacillota bacterium]MCM1393662.1 amidophosphoribosyltransferase [[Eubacterium] siraeum]MCM1455198.1 amidophosphoribosyltransferase [Bacteroides sp.]
MTGHIHEECGVFGIYAKNLQDVAMTAYYALFALQHRGQESAGIVVNRDGVFNAYKDVGLVNDVFDADTLKKLGDGEMAIGHVRYSTTGDGCRENAQPIVVNHFKGNMALAHNGNITNSYELRSMLESEGSIFHTTADTEVISYVITKERIKTGSIEQAVLSAMGKIKGAYSLVIMSPSKLIAARDPHGFRPLCYGVRDDGAYVVASESCALDSVGAKRIRDIEPGEVIVFSSEGVKNYTQYCGKPKHLCAFELLYIARPDSVIDGCSVHNARIKAGKLLARQFNIDADIVVGVPDSGLDAALGYSKESGIPYGIGIIKNKYIGRTFIAPDQKAREDKVRIKLNVLTSAIKDKRVILVDDSIVRGTTCGRIVKLLKDAGAKEVHMLSSAPAFMNPCYYGTDIDSREHLIACHHSTDEIAKIIGADSVGYLDINNVAELTDGIECGFCCACFDGKYPTEVPSNTNKNRFESPRSENPKFKK